MTADTKGLTVSTATLRWFNIMIAICALVGPPVAFILSISTNRAALDEKVSGRFELNEGRIARNETDLHDLKSDLRDIKTDLNQKLDKIDSRLQGIEQSVSHINGKMGAQAFPKGGTSILAESRGV